eukprot:symbB.v1.2.013326.t1/scaffold941.1/size221885/1
MCRTDGRRQRFEAVISLQFENSLQKIFATTRTISTFDMTLETSTWAPTAPPMANAVKRPATLDALRRNRLKAVSRVSTLESVPEDLPTECSEAVTKPSLQALVDHRQRSKLRARERLVSAVCMANSSIFD